MDEWLGISQERAKGSFCFFVCPQQVAPKIQTLRAEEKSNVVSVLGPDANAVYFGQASFAEDDIEANPRLYFVVIVFAGINVADSISNERYQAGDIVDLTFDSDVVRERNTLGVLLRFR
ncbi:hypothetical protein ACFWZ3_04560 [Frateuria sp. GZRR35]|uniref:hypothetical protein n=1 Tax=Frateuria sp. GZRR35 TaxID=3351536 RepID=UPI003EDBDBEB